MVYMKNYNSMVFEQLPSTDQKFLPVDEVIKNILSKD